jgi:hypothetical protein
LKGASTDNALGGHSLLKGPIEGLMGIMIAIPCGPKDDAYIAYSTNIEQSLGMFRTDVQVLRSETARTVANRSRRESARPISVDAMTGRRGNHRDNPLCFGSTLKASAVVQYTTRAGNLLYLPHSSDGRLDGSTRQHSPVCRTRALSNRPGPVLLQ